MVIGDFGLSYSFYSLLSSSTRSLCGTKIYMSPEQLGGEEYGKVASGDPGSRRVRPLARGLLPAESRPTPLRRCERIRRGPEEAAVFGLEFRRDRPATRLEVLAA